MTRKQLAACVAAGLAAAGLAAYLKQAADAEIRYGAARVRFTPAVTEAEARRAGDLMDAGGFFGDHSRDQVVQFDKRGDTYLVRLPQRTDAPADAALVAACRRTAAALSRDAFGGAPVEVHLTDGWLQTRHVVPAD